MKKKLKHLTLRDKKIGPLVTTALNKCIEVCDKFVLDNDLSQDHLIIIGTDKPLDNLDLPLNVSLIYFKYKDKPRIDFTLFYDDVDVKNVNRVQSIIETLLVKLLEGINLAKKSGVDDELSKD